MAPARGCLRLWLPLRPYASISIYSSFKHLRVVLLAQEISKVFVQGDLLTMDIAGAAES